jgi:hypothetical protein
MTRTALLRSWFVRPPLDAKGAITWFLIAMPAAALIRASMECGDMAGECCTPLFLFVLLSAILLGWAGAVLATVASIVTAALFWPGAHHMHANRWEFWGVALFILYSALIIGAVEFTRRTFARFSRLADLQEHSSGIIFSVERGQAWASWPGSPVPVRLGPQDEVAEMMEDFIAQRACSERLARASRPAAGTPRRADAP